MCTWGIAVHGWGTLNVLNLPAGRIQRVYCISEHGDVFILKSGTLLFRLLEINIKGNMIIQLGGWQVYLQYMSL